jgi:hypothetical protein
MELGFETAGNATLVCYDRCPVLVTDPWITGHAYFGSWGLSHEIPEAVMEGIRGCQYVWISHGHPDHLSPRSLDLLQGKKILLPDHVGGRIRDGLKERGFEVTVMNNRQWYPLSDRIRVLCIADYNQDAILLADIDGRLVFDMNDADDHGWGSFIKQIIRKYDVSFHLQLTGFGDTDMINFWREDGAFITPRAARRRPVGATVARLMRQWGTRYFVPFSSMHVYQRTDSAWASIYKTNLADYRVGFASDRGELLPGFIRYDAVRDRVEELNPPENLSEPREPEVFGDDWSEPLGDQDRQKLNYYFKSIEHLREFLDFIAFRVGGREHVVELTSKRFDRGITFDAPRASLMTSIENEIFDDMLIGNFMKATLHGKFPPRPLYPDFIPYVAKYADNGLAKSNEQVREYFRRYREEAPLDFVKHRIESRAIEMARASLAMDSPLYTVGARTYHWIKSLTA